MSDRYTPQDLADVLERDYFPMPNGKTLYLNEYEWKMVIAALRASPFETATEKRIDVADVYMEQRYVDLSKPENRAALVARAKAASSEAEELEESGCRLQKMCRDEAGCEMKGECLYPFYRKRLSRSEEKD